MAGATCVFGEVGIASGEEVLVGSNTISGVDVGALVGGAVAVPVAVPVSAIVGSAWQDAIDILDTRISMRVIILFGICKPHYYASRSLSMVIPDRTMAANSICSIISKKPILPTVLSNTIGPRYDRSEAVITIRKIQVCRLII